MMTFGRRGHGLAGDSGGSRVTDVLVCLVPFFSVFTCVCHHWSLRASSFWGSLCGTPVTVFHGSRAPSSWLHYASLFLPRSLACRVSREGSETHQEASVSVSSGVGLGHTSLSSSPSLAQSFSFPLPLHPGVELLHGLAHKHLPHLCFQENAS